MVLLVLADVAATVAHTVPDIAASHGAGLQLLDRICVAVFAIEYAARMWTAPEHPLLRQRTPLGARLRFAATPLMVIDALALLPLALELLFPRNGLILLTRLVRFLKLARYSPALATIGRLIASERRALLACVIIFIGALLAAAAAMLVVEGSVQPDKLGDMPKAMWWAASMLAKIGGGDLTPPLTTLGRIIAAITVMLGIGCFALPVAIIGRGFYEEIRRRDFVVTFAMVARVPLFARLDAAAIADLVAILRARTVPSGTTIIRRGDRGDAMYLIASGRVEVESAAGKVVLDEGEFFGEMALLSREPRSATVTSLRSTDLLVLDADDFLRLVDRLPDIGAKVRAVAKDRRPAAATNATFNALMGNDGMAK
ncbi:MAG: cyclic nucleotide-binding domain-containing protein [Hyphomicrobiaceae bacterium]|nr:cyclic nucleotide-binding domain-containing protein [Hyphomicrobiaceae bacterium]